MDVMREEGRADATLKDIRNIMTKLNKSADEAMDILDVPIKERETLKTQLQSIIQLFGYLDFIPG